MSLYEKVYIYFLKRRYKAHKKVQENGEIRTKIKKKKKGGFRRFVSDHKNMITAILLLLVLLFIFYIYISRYGTFDMTKYNLHIPQYEPGYKLPGKDIK